MGPVLALKGGVDKSDLSRGVFVSKKIFKIILPELSITKYHKRHRRKDVIIISPNLSSQLTNGVWLKQSKPSHHRINNRGRTKIKNSVKCYSQLNLTFFLSNKFQ